MTNDLKFVWKAEFDDGTILDQFEEEIENPFSLVEDNMDSLVKFSVVSVEDSREVYTADLTTGVISGNGILEQVTGSEFELVYKRRNQIRAEVGTNKIIESRVTHIMGLKSSVDEKEIEIFQPVGVLNKRVNVSEPKKKLYRDVSSSLSINKPSLGIRDLSKIGVVEEVIVKEPIKEESLDLESIKE